MTFTSLPPLAAFHRRDRKRRLRRDPDPDVIGNLESARPSSHHPGTLSTATAAQRLSAWLDYMGWMRDFLRTIIRVYILAYANELANFVDCRDEFGFRVAYRQKFHSHPSVIAAGTKSAIYL